jgi:hypothetical protein
MNQKLWQVGGVAALCLCLALGGGWASDAKPTDEGKGSEFKGKKFAMKDKGEVAILLFFQAGKEFEATTDGTKKTDVHLFVYDAAKKVVAKDDSPGPSCDLTFTPKEAGQFTLVVRNLGPGDNRATLKVELAKAKGKSQGND